MQTKAEISLISNYTKIFEKTFYFTTKMFLYQTKYKCAFFIESDKKLSLNFLRPKFAKP